MQEFQLPSGEKVCEIFSGYASKEQLNAAMNKRRVELEAQGGTLLRREKVGRNDPCPCKSGQKFKRCCIDKFDGVHGSYVRVA